MVIDVALNSRVAQLLGRIEETRRHAQEHPEGSNARLALEARIVEFYAEAGRYLHWLVRQDPASLARMAEEGRRWAEGLGGRLEVILPEISAAEVEFEELDEEESVEKSVSEMPIELTGDSRVYAVDFRQVVQGDAGGDADDERATEPEPVQVADEAAADLDVDDLEEVSVGGEGDASDDTGIVVRTGSHPVPVGVDDRSDVVSASSARSAAGDEDAWMERLKGLLEVLGPPASTPGDRTERAAAVRSLAVATTNLEVRWAVFPDAVQQALLGLVGARARRLDEELASDPDVRLALGRMRRFSEQRGVAPVPALREGGGQPRNWAADERRYWTVLHTGI